MPDKNKWKPGDIESFQKWKDKIDNKLFEDESEEKHKEVVENIKLHNSYGY